MSNYRKIYAVDFDGTLAKTRFPEIISPNIPVFMLCKEIKRRGDILILWTCRCDKDLDEAVQYCKKYGLEFDYINENTPDNVIKWGNDSRKIFANEYIDDKAWSPIRDKEHRQSVARAFIRGAASVTKVTKIITTVLQLLLIVLIICSFIKVAGIL